MLTDTNALLQLMITASPDDPAEVSLTTSLQPAADRGADYSEQSMFVSTLLLYASSIIAHCFRFNGILYGIG